MSGKRGEAIDAAGSMSGEEAINTVARNSDDPLFTGRKGMQQEEGSVEGGVTSINLFTEKGCWDMIFVV